MVRLKNITRSTLVFASGRVLKPEEELQVKTISAELTEGLMRGWLTEAAEGSPAENADAKEVGSPTPPADPPPETSLDGAASPPDEVSSSSAAGKGDKPEPKDKK